jgi:hypothetical protein
MSIEIEEQILSGKQLQSTQQSWFEESRGVETLQQFIASQQFYEDVLAPQPHTPDEPKVIQSQVVALDFGLRFLQRESYAEEKLSRRIANADGFRAGVLQDSLGNQSGGIGEVYDPRFGCDALNGPRLFDGNRDGAKSHGKTTRTRCFLPREAMGNRQALIARAPLHSTGADTADHEAAVSHSFVKVRGDIDTHGGAGSQRPSQPSHSLSRLGIAVTQDHVCDIEACVQQAMNQ